MPGFLLREARQDAGMTQGRLARLLGITQQAVSRAEQWSSNPTVALMRRWLGVCGWRLDLRVEPVETARSQPMNDRPLQPS